MGYNGETGEPVNLMALAASGGWGYDEDWNEMGLEVILAIYNQGYKGSYKGKGKGKGKVGGQ